LKLLERRPDVDVHWVVFSADGVREREARRSASLFLKRARHATILVKDFRDGFFPFVGADIKMCFEELKESVTPDLVFTHYRADRHQDHRLISDLTWNTFRSHLVLEYEIPKYDGDLGSPNCFVTLDESICRRKVKHLLATFKTQAEKRWFSDDTFNGLLRLRGIEAGASAAEAFYARKLLLESPQLASS
jgi:LmbE family N-acetylglucosaminyl deacetylase